MSRVFLEATSLEALLAATERAARGKRGQPDVARFLMDAERGCLALSRALRRPPDQPGAWRPGPPRRFSIRDPKPRTITAVPFSDRVVHHALCAVAVPRFERQAIFDSYACRPGRGQHAALARARRFAQGAPWALKADVRAYFASIPLSGLIALVRRLVADAGVRRYLEIIIEAGAVAPGRGLPIGALTSQHLANLYLSPLDHYIKDDLGVKRYLRYMDDLLLFGEREEVRAWLPRIAARVQALGLSLNPRATRVMPVRDGVPFLGYSVYPGVLRLRPERLRRFRRLHRAWDEALRAGRVSEEEAAASVASQFAHLGPFDTYRVRRAHLLRLRAGGSGGGRTAGGAGGVVGQRREERARLEPRQELPLQPRREPGFSSVEFSAQRRMPQGPDGPGPRTGPPCQGADQVPGPCHGLRPVTESQPPGGGPRQRGGVAAGHFSPRRVL